MRKSVAVVLLALFCAHFILIQPAAVTAKTTKKAGKKSGPQIAQEKSEKTASDKIAGKDRIVEIAVTGNDHVNQSVVLLSLTMKVGDVLSEAAIDENMKRVYNLGYFTQDIGVDVVTAKNGKKVVFKVKENPVVQNIKIKGSTLVPAEKLARSMQTKAGQVFNTSLIGSDVKAIQKVLDEAGYIMNRVRDVQFDGETLLITVEENKIEHIKIVGNEKTRDRVILRELKFKEGEYYDDKKVTKSLQKIFNLGYFSEVKPRCEQGSAPGLIDFIIEVKEQKTGTITIGGGYSSANGIVGIFEISQKNWRGKGQVVNLKFEFGGMRTYEAGFLEPWFNNKKMSVGGDIYSTKITQRYYRSGLDSIDYTEERKGFDLTVGKSFTDIVDGSITFRDENVKLSNADAIRNLLNANYIREGHYQTLSEYVGRDTRDNIYDPTRGSYHAINIDTTGGFLKGPDSFTKYRITLRKYTSLNKKDVVAARVMAGDIKLNSGTLPLYEEYGVGGVYTLRGYEWREFIGKKMLVGNLEFRHRFAKNFDACLFFDAGDAWSSDSIASLNNANLNNDYSLKKGYGIGVNFTTPIGPIRLDYGKGQDRSGKAYFSMGRMF